MTGLSPYLETLASGSHASATTETFDVSTRGRRGVIVLHDVTTASGFSTTVTVQGVDPVSGDTWNILSSAAIVAAGLTALRVHPTIASVANASAADLLPATIRVKVTHTDATAIVRTLAVQLVD